MWCGLTACVKVGVEPMCLVDKEDFLPTSLHQAIERCSGHILILNFEGIVHRLCLNQTLSLICRDAGVVGKFLSFSLKVLFASFLLLGRRLNWGLGKEPLGFFNCRLGRSLAILVLCHGLN